MRRLAAKAFILNPDYKILVIKRSDDAEYKPDVWEFPGGRIEEGECLIETLKREVKEETGIDIDVGEPLKVHKFRRLDEDITLTCFLCRHISGSVVLSDEHSTYEWINIDEAHSRVGHFYEEEIEIVKKRFKN